LQRDTSTGEMLHPQAISRQRPEPSPSPQSDQAKYRTLFEVCPQGILIVDPVTTQVVEFNPAAENMLGYPPEKLGTLKLTELAVNVRPQTLRKRIQNVQKKGFAAYEITVRTRAGKKLHLYLTMLPICLNGRQLLYCLFRDVGQRKQAEEALRESEERFRELMERIPDGVYRSTPEGKFLEVNSALVRMLGYSSKEELLQVDIPHELYFTPEERERAVQRLQKSPGEVSIYRLRRKDGSEVWVEEHGLKVFRPGGNVYYEGVLRDITERRRLEEELARAQRLETAGRVAGQIAHDFNNLLSPLAGYPGLIRAELPPGHPVLEMVEEMEFAANKIAEINQQLLALGRRGHYLMEPIDLNDLLQKVVLSQNLPDTIEIREEFCSELLLIKGGAAQLTRALINLIVNAAEAMRHGGTMTLRTENVYLDEVLRGYKTINVGEYVKLEVSDTGSGISPDIIDKIFDPFFTTKRTDRKRGSGLGLSVVYNIVEDHNGYVTVESTVGKGTTFALYFPVSREQEIVEAAEMASGGTERILVVDDDPVQRKVATQLLSRLGYQAESVGSGEAAIRHVKKHPQDLLIIDMVMDGIDGTETYRRILDFAPQQRAIILSGYAMSQRVEEALRLGAGSFVTKPITLQSLARAVRNELDRPPKTTLTETPVAAS